MEQAHADALTIFGEHDEGTIRQMRACMEVGSVHRGVLCADGHKGYALLARYTIWAGGSGQCDASSVAGSCALSRFSICGDVAG